jgi:nucleotide sugar dehydrogenase
MSIKKGIKPCVIGLGYVGLPLLLEISKKFKFSVGFDTDVKRINDLKKKIDTNLDIPKQDFRFSKNIFFTADKKKIRECNFYIVAVPTPIDKYKKPDMKILKKASLLIGEVIKNQDIVVFESTVFPGATEEICKKIIEKKSNLKAINDLNDLKKGFYLGYSPERVNPGDKKRKISDIKKVVSCSSKKGIEKIKFLYAKIIKAGIHVAESIKIAEAAKIIENIQRDINIALINEFSIICNKLNINTNNVLRAAKTKWNFLDFKPGLVGGHCIGVDPYYLAYKSVAHGYKPLILLSGRKINESMHNHIVQRIIEISKQKKVNLSKSNTLIIGGTFKEDCSDTRNSKVFDLIKYLKLFTSKIDLYDPYIKEEDLKKFDINLCNNLKKKYYSIIIIAVPHKILHKHLKNLKKLLKNKKKSIIFDVKSYLKSGFDGQL